MTAVTSWLPPPEPDHDPWDDGQPDVPIGEQSEPPRKRLDFRALADLMAAVDAAGEPRWLFEPVWPSDAYGVLAAEDKAGKSWAAVDAAVSVASGTPWLGVYPVGTTGPALLFAGEGGERNLVRRVRAVAGSRGLDPARLPLRVCLRVPHLTRADDLAELGAEIAEHRPRLVVLDPLYLAARGASGSDLYAMGEVLEGVQHVCQQAGAALQVVTHFNKGGEGHGARRITGVGPGAWGRVLATAHVESRTTDPQTKASSVVLALQFVGGEIPDSTLRLRRRVWAEDPSRLSSPLHYELEQVTDEPPSGLPHLDSSVPPAASRVLAVLAREAGGLTVSEIGDRLAQQARPLKKRTIQEALGQLGDRVDAVELDGRGTRRWFVTELGPEGQS